MMELAFTAEPAVGDGRPSLAFLHAQYDSLLNAGWQKVVLALQTTEQGEPLPICAYFNSPRVEQVLIGGIHGREPAGAIALARYAQRLVLLGQSRSILLMPLLNPWGYHFHQRYGPSGQSVSDSDHWLGRQEHPACPEAAAITTFVMEGIGIAPGAAVLDLHEDPVYEAEGYVFEGRGSYVYVSGKDGLAQPAARRVIHRLTSGHHPLILEGTTRFGERLAGGVIVDTEDGSIDELLAKKKGCSPVITTELVLTALGSPALPERIDTYLGVLDAFFGL